MGVYLFLLTLQLRRLFSIYVYRILFAVNKRAMKVKSPSRVAPPSASPRITSALHPSLPA
eukprot:6183539-Pleurochrysis_carterae.AAC.1